MRLLLLTILAIFCLPARAADSRAIYLGENPSREDRQRIEHFFKPFHDLKEYYVTKIDLNRDSIPEYVILLSEESISLLILDLETPPVGALYRVSFPGGISKRAPDIVVFSGLTENHDSVLLRSPTTCGLLEWHQERWRTGFVDCGLEVSDFVEQRRSCALSNGKWQVSQSRCIWPTTDADKVCSDTSDCQGLCIYSGPWSGNLAQSVTGKCSDKTGYESCVSTVVKNRLVRCRIICE